MNIRLLLLVLTLCWACESGSHESPTNEESAQATAEETSDPPAVQSQDPAEADEESDEAAADRKPDTSALMTEEITPYECGEIRNVHTYRGFVFGGQPSAEDLRLVREAGVRTVFNLRPEREMTDYDEKQAVNELGMEYISLPFSGEAELTDEVFDRSREILQSVERPVLFHCGSANRVGALWIPYRVLEDGISVEEALAEAKVIGLRTPAYEEKALDYVRRQKE